MVGMVVVEMVEEPVESVGMVVKVEPVVKGKHDSPQTALTKRSLCRPDIAASCPRCRR
jgi:hypothetical protein